MILEQFKSQSRDKDDSPSSRPLKAHVSNVFIRSYSIIKHIYRPLDSFRNAFQKFKFEVQFEFDRTRIRFVPFASLPPLPSSLPVKVALEVEVEVVLEVGEARWPESGSTPPRSCRFLSASLLSYCAYQKTPRPDALFSHQMPSCH
jgi:hypothetical protein